VLSKSSYSRRFDYSLSASARAKDSVGRSAELPVVAGTHIENPGPAELRGLEIMVCMNDDVLEGFEGKNYDPGELFAEWSASLVA